MCEGGIAGVPNCGDSGRWFCLERWTVCLVEPLASFSSAFSYKKITHLSVTN